MRPLTAPGSVFVSVNDTQTKQLSAELWTNAFPVLKARLGSSIDLGALRGANAHAVVTLNGSEQMRRGRGLRAH
jgi:hypothetical protein